MRSSRLLAVGLIARLAAPDTATQGPASDACRDPAVTLATVMHADRVTDDDYRLIMFRTNHDAASGFVLMHRSIEHMRDAGGSAIRVREANVASGAAVTIDVDARSLRPLSYQSTSGDTLSVSATVHGDSMRITETRLGVVKNSVVASGSGLYLSNSFSELVQSTDFGTHPHVCFSTVTPGAAANTFDVERIGRRTFARGVAVWVLKFTRIDAGGAAVPAGYRYVDAKTGKVVFFATELDSPSAFSYQVLPLH